MCEINFGFVFCRSDPATGGWVSSWMSGFALAVLIICLVGGAIFAVVWARRNKRIMKASYPGKIQQRMYWSIYRYEYKR